MQVNNFILYNLIERLNSYYNLEKWYLKLLDVIGAQEDDDNEDKIMSTTEVSIYYDIVFTS
jgi:hypothetical protein